MNAYFTASTLCVASYSGPLILLQDVAGIMAEFGLASRPCREGWMHGRFWQGKSKGIQYERR